MLVYLNTKLSKFRIALGDPTIKTQELLMALGRMNVRHAILNNRETDKFHEWELNWILGDEKRLDVLKQNLIYIRELSAVANLGPASVRKEAPLTKTQQREIERQKYYADVESRREAERKRLRDEENFYEKEHINPEEDSEWMSRNYFPEDESD